MRSKTWNVNPSPRHTTNAPVVPSGQPQRSLAVDNVTYAVEESVGPWWHGCCLRPIREREVLHEVTGHFHDGQLTAILGNSGSGKTTLLDLIAGRLAGGKVSGSVLMDGRPLSRELFRQEAAYVIQADRLLANLTVQETLTFTAQLHAAQGRGTHEIHKEVDVILSDLGLKHISESLVGGSIIRGISGGERRRVSIGVQLLQDPALLLLDEPTTGLDSFTAHDLVCTLNELAQRRGMIIIMTVHQPRSDIFCLFDQICILSQGSVVYFGPRDQLVPHFTSAGFPCPTYSNPLDHYVDVASIDHRSAEVEALSMERMSKLTQYYQHSPVYASITNALAVASCRDMLSLTPTMQCSSPQPANFGRILSTLLRRMYLNLWRSRSGFVVRSGQIPLFGLIILMFIGRLSKQVDTAVQDRTGIIYQSLSVPAMGGVLCAAAYFASIRDLYFREAREGLCNCYHMLLAYFIHIMPFILIASMGYSVIVFWGCGLYPDPVRFAIFWAVCFVQQYIGELLGVACLAIFHEAPLAQATATLLVSAFALIASGFFRSQQHMLEVVDWLGYALNTKWASEIFNANEFHLLTFDCAPGNELPCEVFNGDTYLNAFFPNAVENMARNGGILAGYTLSCILLVILLFRIRGITQLN